MVKFVGSLEEFNNILSQAGNKLVVVDFTASWCGPCKMISPVFEKLAEDPANENVIFLKVDVDEASDVAGNCGIRAMPTFQFYKDRRMVDEFSGADKKKLEDKIKALRQ
ncbi:thioredoxin-like [Xiphophorus hellerii]|uniref:thioredoxin-like n=1 Tax=Xiphophorus hellerii TaxID=8084 RepID=UPI0013B35BCE|nr:thioredoxin-like [Xiphophorus hellerii]